MNRRYGIVHEWIVCLEGHNVGRVEIMEVHSNRGFFKDGSKADRAFFGCGGGDVCWFRWLGWLAHCSDVVLLFLLAFVWFRFEGRKMKRPR